MEWLLVLITFCIRVVGLLFIVLIKASYPCSNPATNQECTKDLSSPLIPMSRWNSSCPRQCIATLILWTLYWQRKQVVFVAPLYATVIIQENLVQLKEVDLGQKHYNGTGHRKHEDTDQPDETWSTDHEPWIERMQEDLCFLTDFVKVNDMLDYVCALVCGSTKFRLWFTVRWL